MRSSARQAPTLKDKAAYRRTIFAPTESSTKTRLGLPFVMACMAFASCNLIRALKSQSKDMLASLVEVLQTREDMQELLRRLMTTDDTLEAFSEIGVKAPDLTRVTLEAAVAALVNCQSVKAIDAELKRRVSRN